MTDSSSSQPLYEKVSRHSFFVRSVDLAILALLSSLLIYRIYYINTYDAVWTLAFLCESCFSFVWFLVTVMKWSPAEYKTYPDRLDASFHELPPVDMFVTTADPVMEPPILTVNTVLSLLAVNYPADKLACYVSDDGCSPITYFSLKETSKFAKIWVPFCKRYNVQVRAPFRYFLNPRVNPEGSDSVQFGQDWETMKMEYEKLCRKLEVVSENSDWLYADDDFAAFSNINPRDHSTIVKVIWENKGGVGHYKEVPHLVYIAREKNPKHPHHYKAGAMNVLARVSGLMTNATYMLNVDCDMYANNPDVLRQAMCLFLGSNEQNQYAFVQSPQSFYDSFCDELIVLQTYLGGGINGIHGPFYAGTGGIHRRRVIYGLSPEDLEDDGNLSYTAKGKLLGEDKLEREFGVCNEMVKSAVEALQGKSNSHITLTTSLEAAHRVADCAYEYSTSWGKTIGWLYDSTAEDINTSINIHSKGWKSFYNSPDPPAFLGSMPAGGPEVLGQQRRWAAGLLEVLFNKQSPVIGILYRKLGFRPGVCYLYVLMWGLRSIPELCYSLLPAYCILHNSVFLPKGPCLCIVIALVVMYCLYTLWQYINIGLSIRSWFGSLLFARVKTTCAWLFSIPDIIFKFLGISNMVFILSKKTAPAASGQKDSEADSDGEKFVFDDSIYFLPGTTILLVNLLALVGYLGDLWSSSDSDNGGGSGVGEVFGCVCVVVSFWLFLMGLFEKGKYGIPMSTISKASVLALFFVVFSLGKL